MFKSSLLLFLALARATALYPQAEPENVTPLLKDEILPASVAEFQLRSYLLTKVGALPSPSTSAQWTSDSKRLRQQILDQVVFHGWPKEWTSGPAKVEDLGVIPGNGYQMRKLRYEIVPGFQSVAILYEPLKMSGKVPAVLNVNGHVGAPGKSVEYKQKRCITLARSGILALNLEWLSFGELSHPENNHFNGAHLDLVGVNELGLFYLAMRRGLDYLYDHPNADRSRIGMTGLSGGGWQTIVLSSLDERIRVSVPVAGFSSIAPRVEAKRYGDIGDSEQSATDLFAGRDYPHLVALMAPRPTLLAYNAEDDCCFRAAMVKPMVYDAVRPFFAMYDKPADLAWHENRDPGTHNYQIDNRKAAYAFFGRHFNIASITESQDVAAEVKSYEELTVGLPADNLTILGLAKKFASEIKRAPLPGDEAGRNAERAKLREVLRYRPATIERIWTTGITKHLEVESKSHLFFVGGLPTNAVWLKPVNAPDKAPATIVLDDRGKSATSEPVADRLNRGEQVLAADLPFQGESWKKSEIWAFQQMIYTMGERPLGLEAAHLIALASWLKQRTPSGKVRLESSGIRNQVVALAAAAMEPALFSEVVVRNGMPSLRYVLDKPVRFDEAPDLFCLDLYKLTDLDRLAALAAPAVVK